MNNPTCVLSSAGSSHNFPVTLAAPSPQYLSPDTYGVLVSDFLMGCPIHLSSWCSKDGVHLSFCWLITGPSEADFPFHISVTTSHITFCQPSQPVKAEC